MFNHNLKWITFKNLFGFLLSKNDEKDSFSMLAISPNTHQE